MLQSCTFLVNENVPFIPQPQSTVAFKASAGSNTETSGTGDKEKCFQQACTAI